METQYMPSMDGVGSNLKVVESLSRRVRSCDIILRIFGLVLTFIAVILTGVNKETKIVSITTTIHVPVTAKWQYMSAFMYFVVANAIACSYAAASLLFSMAAKSLKNNAALALNILDTIIMGLLFSANGAATAVGVIGHNGNSHVLWNKVCNMFDGFCHRMTAAIILSLLGSSVFLLLVVLAVLSLHIKAR